MLPRPASLTTSKPHQPLSSRNQPPRPSPDGYHKATAQAEGTASALQSSAKDVSAKALSFTEANLKAAFDHAQKLIQAKDPQEILAHQSEYVKNQLAAMEEHAKELGTAVLKAVTPDK